MHTSGGTKGNAALTADLFGDWREEIVLRKDSNDGVRIFTTTIETEHSIPTLMQDPQYRTAIAWQNESYNQPPWPSFFVGYDMADPQWKPITVSGDGAASEAPYLPADCSVEYKVAADWGDGFVVQVKVTNTGDEPIDGWDLSWRGTGVETVKHDWGGELAAEGGTVTVDPADWNSVIRPGKTRQVGFQGTGDPSGPGMFVLNGRVCAAA
ncbi:hypothetical protein GCM10029992_03090 [Glycomyces albus]